MDETGRNEEAVDLAYEKACEVVTERVKEETVKHLYR